MSTPRNVKLTFDRIVRGETVSRSRVLPASDEALQVEGLLEKGAFNIESTPEPLNADEAVEDEFEAMIASGDFSKLDAIS